jgi:hypothetical protein
MFHICRLASKKLFVRPVEWIPYEFVVDVLAKAVRISVSGDVRFSAFFCAWAWSLKVVAPLK